MDGTSLETTARLPSIWRKSQETLAQHLPWLHRIHTEACANMATGQMCNLSRLETALSKFQSS